MRVYQSNELRNVAIVAHGGSGKTSLTEALLFNSGAINRLGKVDEGNTTTDYYPEEIKRKVTINVSPAPVEWQNHKINILDTPGYSDFIGDVKAALRVADTMMMIVCAVSGVEVQTEIIWQMAVEQGLPRMVFVNKLDRENANFDNVLTEMQEKFEGSQFVPLQLPIGAEEQFEGVVDLITMKALYFDAKGSVSRETEIPADLEDIAITYRESMIEAAAECDDDLLILYLEGEELSAEQILSGLRQGIASAKISPVLCGSALKNIAVRPLMDFMVNFLPSPLTKGPADAPRQPQAVLVYKTLTDPYVGKVSLLRVFQGMLKPDSLVYNTNKEKDEKVAQVMVMQGKTQFPVTEAHCGDLIAVTKLQVTGTGDTLSQKNAPQKLAGIEFPEPSLSIAIKPKSKGDEDKLGNALNRSLEEDVTIKLEKNLETKQTLLIGMGELHLDIIKERLQRKFGVEIETEEPMVPYRETIRTPVSKVEGKHKKQTGGHGQFGHVYIDFAPAPGEEFTFEETIFGGSVPRQYIPAVEKGLRENISEGVLAGYPVTWLRATLVDGSYHPVDSSEMAFKLAAGIAFRRGIEQAKPILLEPLMNVEIRVPEQYMGDIIGDINSKRGKIMGMEPEGKNQLIRAQAPLAEMYRYAIDLKSITQGRGSFKMVFNHYEEVPANLADKIIEKARAAREE